MSLSKKTALIIFVLLFPAFLISLFLIVNIKAMPMSSNLALFAGMIVAWALIISGIVSISLWFIFRKVILRPINEFSRVTKIINSGNLGSKMVYNKKDEFGELAVNFNSIITNLTRNAQSMANSLRDEREKENELAANVAKLQETQAKDEALLGNLGEGVIAIDERGMIFLFNKSATVLTGYSSEEALGKHYRNLLRFEFEKEKDLVPDFVYAVLNKVTIKELAHIQIVTKYDQRVPVTHSTTMITDKNQKNFGVIVVLRNITRERQLDKLKDEFVSIASHELRTPMTAIKGLISMIFEGDYGKVDPQMQEPLADIASSTQRLIELVNDMLDVSRLEGGRIKYELKNVKVAELIKEVLELMHPVAVQKGVELRFSQQAGIEEIQVDANKVKQILSNLIGNSMKFTDKGFIEVRYVIHDQLLIISVRDTGIGIKPEDQKKLFSKFQQVTSSQLGRPVGTGLGLYISREFAKKMGGDLWIANSLVGVGSVFSLSVPIAGTELARMVEHDILAAVESPG